jgi:hypothetical protein
MAAASQDWLLELFSDEAQPDATDALGLTHESPEQSSSIPVIEQEPAQPAPSPAPVASVAGLEPVEGISDAGEELIANRRNRNKVGMNWSDLEGLNDTLKVMETTKANVWPKPDYEAMIEQGMQPMVAHVFKQAYDSIAAKPAVRGGISISDKQLRSYVETLKMIEKGLQDWCNDREALSAWTQANMRTAGAMLGLRTNVSDLIERATLLKRVFPDGWRAHRDAVMMCGGNKLLGALQPGYDEIRRASKAIDQGWPRKREAWEVQGFKIVERPLAEIHRGFKSDKFSLVVGGHYVGQHETEALAEAARAALKPFMLTGKRGFLGTFDTEELAIAEAKSRARGAKAKGNGAIDRGSNVVLAERIGPARRLPDEDISSERLLAEFGFKGVNFGNWMKTPAARAEAQLHLNHAFDALHDLAEILKVPPKALSLGGMLGIAFGAQGHGGKFAGHFVAGLNEINLTRTAGAGVLAHEFGHALDHYFARQAGLDKAEVPYLSEHAELPAEMVRHKFVDGKMVPVSSDRFGELRPEILGGFKAIASVMKKRLQTEEEAKGANAARIARLEKNISGWLASIRKDFKGVEEMFDKLADKVRAGDLGEGKVQVGATTLLSPAVSQMRDLYKEKHGRVYSIDPLKGLQSNVDGLVYAKEQAAHYAAIGAGSATPASRQTVSTDYLMAAKALDVDKGGKPYWSTGCEMFARAFDSYVSDRLEKSGTINSYLAFGVREDRDVPTGRDRDVIHGAFDKLISEFCVRESEMGPAIFSVGASKPSVPERITREAIEAEVERMRAQWKDMPPVHVVDQVADLPFNAPPLADGAYHDGQVYVVAGNIVDLAQVQKVMAHECVLHHSMEEMLGAYGFAKLHHGVQSLKAKGDATVVALAEDVRSRYGDLPADIETKEIVARAGEKCLDDTGNIRVEYGFMKSVFAGVAGWLRDHGIKIPFTNVELQGILHSSGQWARTGKTQGIGAGAEGLLKRAGHFVGKILGVSDGVVTQRVHRSGLTAIHSVAALDAPVAVGDIADIHYVGGRGHVKTQQRELGR